MLNADGYAHAQVNLYPASVKHIIWCIFRLLAHPSLDAKDRLIPLETRLVVLCRNNSEKEKRKVKGKTVEEKLRQRVVFIA